MKKQILKGTNLSELERAYDKIMVWFFAFQDTDFTLNELCKNLEIAKTTANIVVSKFERMGFLTCHVLGKVWRIRAKPTHVFFVTHKIPFNLKSVYESGVLEWVNNNIPDARAIILFGSYRKGDDTEKSDVDIAVEVLRDSEPEIINLQIAQMGYRKNVPLNIQVFSRNKIDLNLFANIANGIILHGFLEVRP